MAQTFFGAYTLDRGSESYEIEFEYSVGYWGCAAQVSGPPESCYPAEGMEIEFEGAWIDAPMWARDKYPHGAMPFALSDAERWKIEEWIQDHPPEPDYDDEYDYERHPLAGDF
jgi:hypothetical protein